MRFMYVWRELYLRKRRHFTAIFGLAVGVSLLIVLHALSGAYKEATRVPLQEIGADISIQRSGDVPEELQGVTFPCSAVTITHLEVETIRQMPGIRSVAQSLLMWVFEGDQFTMVMGIDPESVLGPGKLRNYLVKGAFLEGTAPQALVDETFAREKKIDVGGSVTITGTQYPVVGLVETSRASKMVAANVYLPLPEAQALAKASPQVQGASPFAAQDANLVFIVADNEAIPALSAKLKEALGSKAVISTPESFLRKLGTLFALSDTFASTTSAIVLVVTFLLVLKTIAGSIQERAKEIGVLKCLGWTNGNIARQLTAESITQCFLAGILGIIIAGLACWLLSFQTLNILIPWEMSPTPHFLPGGGDPIFKSVQLPVRLSWPVAGLALLLSLIVGAATSLLCIRRITHIKPSEVLRHE